MGLGAVGMAHGDGSEVLCYWVAWWAAHGCGGRCASFQQTGCFPPARGTQAPSHLSFAGSCFVAVSLWGICFLISAWAPRGAVVTVAKACHTWTFGRDRRTQWTTAGLTVCTPLLGFIPAACLRPWPAFVTVGTSGLCSGAGATGSRPGAVRAVEREALGKCIWTGVHHRAP